MKIVVITGTMVRGCTYHMKEFFLEKLREGNEITDFYLPRDLPHFCTGCKACFLQSENHCPHAEYTIPIWSAMLDADLLLFAAPVYALRTPGQMKALLDHLCVHWIVHRPAPAMFRKKAVILTNSIGAPNGAAQREIAASLAWLGISHIRQIGFGTMGNIVWKEIPTRRRRKIENKLRKLAEKYQAPFSVRRGLKARLFFLMGKMLHQMLQGGEETLSADSQYWLDRGWLHGKRTGGK